MRTVAVLAAGRALALPACFGAALLLAGCGPNDNDPGPGGVTVGEARALDEAAEMLDARSMPEDEALPPAAASNGADEPSVSGDPGAAG